MAYFDRFDIVAAHYAWLVDHHRGQGSAEYARMCAIGAYFKPGRASQGREGLSENGRDIYDELCARDGMTCACSDAQRERMRQENGPSDRELWGDAWEGGFSKDH